MNDTTLRRMILTGVACAVLAGAVLPASAEAVRLTLEEAIALGLENSTSIASKRAAVAAAQEDLKAARAGYYPSVSAGMSWTHLYPQPESAGFDIPGFATVPGSYVAASDPVGLSVDVSQTVTTFGKIRGGVRLAEEAVAQSGLGLEEERRRLIIRIKQAFYGYLLAREVLAINEETFEGKQDTLAIARTRFQAGVVSDFEVLRAESDLESFRSNVISAANSVQVALLNAQNALGVEGQEVELELLGELTQIPVTLDRGALVARATSTKYEVLSFRKNIDILKAQQSLNRSMHRPTLVAWANYSLSSGFDAATGDNLYFEADAWDGSLTAGLRLSVPISGLLPWSKETATVRKTAIQLEDLALQFRSLASGVRLAVESSILRIGEEQAKIDSGRKSIELAQRLYDSAVEQYEGGYISSTDLRDAQLGLNAARLGYTQAVFGYNQNVLALMDAVGVADF